MAGTRPRDSQWTKFNNILGAMRPGFADLQTWEQANTYLSKVVGSAWWKKRYSRPLSSRQITTTCQAGWNIATQSGGIPLRTPCSKVDILHPLAHLLVPADAALHGPEFCKEFAGLVERFLGQQSKLNLLSAFRVNGVKFRTWSPEARARAVERAAKNGTPFGTQRAQLARDGVIGILRDLAGVPTPESDDPIDRMLNAAKEAQ